MEKRNRRNKIRAGLLIGLAAFMLWGLAASAGPVVRGTDVTVPKDGNVIVNVPGWFYRENTDTVLSLVNGYRQEACALGYPNPENPAVTLTMADYYPVKWSSDLEWIAQTRAAEGVVLQGHERPNGSWCFSASHNGIFSSSETLAWNYSGLLDGIRQWYGEKDDWVARNRNAVTGHYTAMINPSLRYIGIGCFLPYKGGYCIAGEYSEEESLTELPAGAEGEMWQRMEVPAANVMALTVTGPEKLTSGWSGGFTAKQYVAFPRSGDTQIIPDGVAVWSTSDPQTVSIDQMGFVNAEKPGTVTVTLVYGNEPPISKTLTVIPPEKGMELTLSEATYIVTEEGKTVEYGKYTGEAAKTAVPATVTAGGIRYTVTSVGEKAFYGKTNLKTVTLGKNIKTIGSRAFYNCKKLSAVTIPAKVTSIGKKAFYNCKKLKNITIKTKKLKAAKVGSGAFGKTGAKKITVPGGKKNAYTKWLRARGIGKKVTIR